MTSARTQKLSEQPAGVRAELMFSEGEAKLCSQFLGASAVKSGPCQGSFESLYE